MAAAADRLAAAARHGAGIGLGWRPEVALLLLDRPDLAFTEVIAESIAGPARRDGTVPTHVPHHLAEWLTATGRPCIPHGVKLGLGGAERPAQDRIARLAAAARAVDAPLVSEHLAFVRAGGIEIGHLTPLPRTRAMVDLLVEHIGIVADGLPVPFAVEHAAALFGWPDDELDEAAFVAEVVGRSGAALVLDLANVVVGCANHGGTPSHFLDTVPLEQVAYVHVAGGVERDGLRHDTHAHPLWPEVLDLVAEVAERAPWAPVLLERDDRFPPRAELEAELDSLTDVRIVPSESVTRRPLPRPAASNRSREEGLADRQAELARALVAGGPVPDGFDAGRIAVAADALRHKRAGEVRDRFPALAHALDQGAGFDHGPGFETAFVAYARTVPPPGSTVADGLAFAATLDRAALTEQARDELAVSRRRGRGGRRGFRGGPPRGPRRR